MKMVIECELPENMTANQVNDAIAGIAKIAGIFQMPVRFIQVMPELREQPIPAFLRGQAE